VSFYSKDSTVRGLVMLDADTGRPKRFAFDKIDRDITK
jgi:hypothetical protein